MKRFLSDWDGYRTDIEKSLIVFPKKLKTWNALWTSSSKRKNHILQEATVKNTSQEFAELLSEYQSSEDQNVGKELLKSLDDNRRLWWSESVKSTVKHGNDRSRRYVLKNDLPQGSVLKPMPFDIYTHDIPQTTSEFINADDIDIPVQVFRRSRIWS